MCFIIVKKRDPFPSLKRKNSAVFVSVWRRGADIYQDERRRGGLRRGGETLEASAHEQLVFQILMVLNTKRPYQIPTAEVSDGK